MMPDKKPSHLSRSTMVPEIFRKEIPTRQVKHDIWVQIDFVNLGTQAI